MLKYVQGLLSGRERPESRAAVRRRDAAPEEVVVDGAPRFALRRHVVMHNGYPILDQEAVGQWIDSVPEPIKQRAWEACERAWLLHFRDALGSAFHYHEGTTAAVLSSLDAPIANATLQYMERTLKRIVAVLQGLANVPEWGKDLLIVFDDQQQYYDYVSFYYPERGEFGFSGGMYISRGAGHFVTVKDDLRAIEPTIAHEMTHACLSHLPLPLWLNEGIAVNTESRLVRPPSQLATPQQMRDKHRRFWGESELQQFWSGKSFGRPDEGQALSYDLARVMVEQLAKDWEPFKRFAAAADFKDGGAAAAHEHLGTSLGFIAAALLEKDASPACDPQPERWEVTPDDTPRSASTE
jgi:hypothetical protein